MASNNLAQYFQKAQDDPCANLYNKHSKAIEAQDDNHFDNTTFLLKRTRSVGLLDEFIAPTKKLIAEDQDHNSHFESDDDNDINDNNNNNNDEDEDNQFIENIETEPKLSTKQKTVHKLYNETNDGNDYFDDNIESKHNNNNINHNELSHSATPELMPHDDNDITYEPSRHVDYLSYNWKESDLSKSWKYIVLKRKDVANSARLENASWRTWAQAKYHLKTISPESVNWLKDSDVTWLYGPLYKDTNTSTLSRNYGSDIESMPTQPKLKKKVKIRGPKPILKKRTVTEILSQPLHHSNNTTTTSTTTTTNNNNNINHIISPPVSPPKIDDDFDLISTKVNAQYSNVNLKDSIQNNTSEIKAPSPIIPQEPIKRHIHFNDRVEQCIAINIPSPEDYEEGYFDHTDADDETSSSDDDDDNDDDDDEGGFFLMVKSPSTTQLHGNNNLSSLNELDDENNNNNDKNNDDKIKQAIKDATLAIKSFQTIELLPSTTLKNCSDDEDDENDNFALSHNTNTSRGYNYHYDYNSVFIGNNNDNYINVNDYDYEDTPQHLEGVSMVDVPEDIVLGSNVEVIDSPTSIHDPQSFINPLIRSNNSSPAESPIQSPLIKPISNSSLNSNSNQLVRNQSNSNFQFNNSDSESDSEDEIKSQPFNSNIIHSSINTNLSSSTSPPATITNKISRSSSYASLSDVAAQGYFAQSISSGNTGNMNQLEKDLKRSSIVDSIDNDSPTEEEEQQKSASKTGFGFLKNWNK